MVPGTFPSNIITPREAIKIQIPTPVDLTEIRAKAEEARVAAAAASAKAEVARLASVANTKAIQDNGLTDQESKAFLDNVDRSMTQTVTNLANRQLAMEGDLSKVKSEFDDHKQHNVIDFEAVKTNFVSQEGTLQSMEEAGFAKKK